MSSPPKPDFSEVLSESKRIINSHPRHFLLLSLLFIFPYTLSSILYPTFQQNPLKQSKNLIIACIYITSGTILGLCAIGTISYSVLDVFHGRPVKLIPTIKSLSKSFFPLLVTYITTQVVCLTLSFIVGFSLFLLLTDLVFLRGGFSYNSPFFIGLCIIGLVFLVSGLVYLQVNWVLANVVAVAELSWGIKSMRRSANLVKGIKGVALSLSLYFAFFIGVFVGVGLAMAARLSRGSDGWKNGAFIIVTATNSALAMISMLHSIAASTVLYINCKAMHGELAWEIADHEYISLPFDDEKVDLVSVVQT